jgi:hypothetical protein
MLPVFDTPWMRSTKEYERAFVEETGGTSHLLQEKGVYMEGKSVFTCLCF